MAVFSFEGFKPIYVVSRRVEGNQLSEEVVSEPIWFTSVSVSPTISSRTREMQQSSEATRLRIVRVAFWVDDCAAPVFETTSYCPTNWTPRIFLSALRTSIQRNQIVHCDCRSRHGSVLNEVHFLFSGTLENTLDVLEGQNAFLLVRGGEEN
jgi:hypothetical protein